MTPPSWARDTVAAGFPPLAHILLRGTDKTSAPLA
jgi:hypothetical protein